MKHAASNAALDTRVDTFNEKLLIRLLLESRVSPPKWKELAGHKERYESEAYRAPPVIIFIESRARESRTGF